METTAKFGVSFLPGSRDDVNSWATLVEELGYSKLGIGDSPSLYRDPWMTLASVATVTDRVPIGIWVTNPTTRHPVVTASAAATLHELAPGRVFIGIGTGDSATHNAGFRPAKLEALDSYVRALRSLLENGETVYEEGRALLSWPRSLPKIPIYVATHGERSIRLAGQIADGVIIDAGIDPNGIRQSLARLTESALAANRRAEDIDVWWYVRYMVSEEEGSARQEMTGLLAENAHVLAAGLKNDPAAAKFHKAVAQLAAEYDMRHYGSTEPHLRRKYAVRARELGVADFLLQRYCIAGTPTECLQQIGRAVSAGARQFTYSLRGPDREGQLRDWHRLVMTQLPDGS